jgi:hypothetical protein
MVESAKVVVTKQFSGKQKYYHFFGEMLEKTSTIKMT